MIGRTSGRLPKRTRKDSGQGRGSPLTRVFAFLETTTDRLFPPGHIINMDSLQRRARSQSHSVSHEMLGKNILDTWLKITEHSYMGEIQYMFIASVKC